jgi:arylsulfatase A-like enzyme
MIYIYKSKININQLSLLDSISAYNSQYTNTPEMDRMVKNGTSFMQSNAIDPVCYPARASWWTGMYSSEHGVVCNGAKCRTDAPDLSRILQKAGYNTYFAGKWHVLERCSRTISFSLEGIWWGELSDTEVTLSGCTFLENF